MRTQPVCERNHNHHHALGCRSQAILTVGATITFTS